MRNLENQKLKNTDEYYKRIQKVMKSILDRSTLEFKKQFYVNALTSTYYLPNFKKGNNISIKVHPRKEVTEKEQYKYKFASDLEIKIKNRFVHFELSDYEIDSLIEDKNYDLPSQIKNSIQSIASTINQSLYEKYKYINQTFVFPEKNWFKVINFMHKQLTSKKALFQDRFLFMNMDAYLHLVENYHIYQSNQTNDFHHYYYGPNQYIGDIGGFKSYYDLSLPYHKSGNLNNDNVGQVKLSLNFKDNVLSLYNLNKGSHLNKGDLFSFEDKPNETYTILKDTYADVNGMLEVEFYPEMERVIPKDSLIKLVPSHFVSLAFQKNAFIYVNRGLDQLESVVDPHALSMDISDLNLSFRLEARRGYEVEVFEFDVAWEMELVDPMHAIRLISL